MNVSAIDPTTTSAAAQSTGAAAPPQRKSPPPAARAASVAALSTPAATVSTTSVPASVKPEDRALYMQILKAVGGNVAAALAALQAKETSEGEK